MVGKKWLWAGCLLSLSAMADIKYDKKDKILGVELVTAKDNKTRMYLGTISKTFPQNLVSVKNAVINFADKCNNSYMKKRKFTDKKQKCKYHNDHLVETFVIKDINAKGWTKEENEIERYILGRKIYNRGEFGHYELIQIFQSKNAEDQNFIKITQTMLNDKQTRAYVKPRFKRESAFKNTVSTFILTETKPQETQLSFEYKAETQHWVLNKEISIPQVFSNMSKSINDLVKTVDAESTIQGRDVASN